MNSNIQKSTCESALNNITLHYSLEDNLCLKIYGKNQSKPYQRLPILLYLPQVKKTINEVLQ